MLTGSVVVHYRSEETLRATLRDILAATGERPVVLVDNSSSASPDPDPRLVHLRPRDNLGYAAAVNLGVREVLARAEEGSAVMVCTHEVRLGTSDVRALVATLDEDPDAAIAAPALVLGRTEDGSVVPWSYGGRLSRWRRRPSHRTSPRPDAEVAWVDGACYVIRTETWCEVGGVPEEFFLYMEDVALGVLVRRTGRTIRVRPEVVVEQRTTGPTRETAIRNWLLFLSRYTSRRHYLLGVADVVGHGAYHLLLGGAAGRAKCGEGVRALAESRRIHRDLTAAGVDAGLGT